MQTEKDRRTSDGMGERERERDDFSDKDNGEVQRSTSIVDINLFIIAIIRSTQQ